MALLVVLNPLVDSALVQTAKLTIEVISVLAEAIWDTKADTVNKVSIHVTASVF